MGKILGFRWLVIRGALIGTKVNFVHILIMYLWPINNVYLICGKLNKIFNLIKIITKIFK